MPSKASVIVLDPGSVVEGFSSFTETPPDRTVGLGRWFVFGMELNSIELGRWDFAGCDQSENCAKTTLRFAFAWSGANPMASIVSRAEPDADAFRLISRSYRPML